MTNIIKTKRELDKYQVISYVSFDLKKAFREKCIAEGQTVSSAIRKFIIQDLNNV